jgi:hypothetical protein
MRKLFTLTSTGPHFGINKLTNQVAQISLNMTPFEVRTHNFTEVLNLLKHGPPLGFNFESALLSVDLPNFDRILEVSSADENNTAVIREEACQILDWLYNQNVRKIISLSTTDSRLDPHSEEVIEKAVARFGVERLDWKRLDLPIMSIFKSAKNLQRLCLYSSGNQAVVQHWLGDQGICQLEKV